MALVYINLHNCIVVLASFESYRLCCQVCLIFLFYLEYFQNLHFYRCCQMQTLHQSVVARSAQLAFSLLQFRYLLTMHLHCFLYVDFHHHHHHLNHLICSRQLFHLHYHLLRLTTSFMFDLYFSHFSLVLQHQDEK